MSLLLTSPLSLIAGLAVVAQPDPVPAAGDVKPGLIYAVVIIGLAVATILLWRNMRTQIKKIDFDDGSEGSTGSKPDGTPGRHTNGDV